MRTHWLGSLASALLSFAATTAHAQDQGGAAAPAPAQGTTPVAAGPANADYGLATGRGTTDSFDLGRSGGGTGSFKGGKDSQGFIGRAMRVPEVHTVERGDTLWDLCGHYFGDPYRWPRVWSYNPQLQNPHWIYPGDELRMRAAGRADEDNSALGEGGFIAHHATVPKQTIFLRNQGFIDDPRKDAWGQIVGAREDMQLLSEGNHVYMTMRAGVELRIGQILTIFHAMRQPDAVEGARRPAGEIVAVKGSVRIDQWDPKTHVARGEIVESVDAVERGALIGPVGRRYDVVPPKRNDTDVWARVMTSIYPHVYVGQNQVVFIDRGTDDGLEPGNRLFIVRRGDTWRRSLKTASRMARSRLRIDDDRHAATEQIPMEGNEKAFPEEIIGELRVLRARKYSSIALVTVSHREIEAGDRAVAKKGY